MIGSGKRGEATRQGFRAILYGYDDRERDSSAPWYQRRGDFRGWAHGKAARRGNRRKKRTDPFECSNARTRRRLRTRRKENRRAEPPARSGNLAKPTLRGATARVVLRCSRGGVSPPRRPGSFERVRLVELHGLQGASRIPRLRLLCACIALGRNRARIAGESRGVHRWHTSCCSAPPC